MLIQDFTLLGLLFVPIILLSFLATLIFLPKWISKAREIGLLWVDMHKTKKKKNVAGSGGVAIVIGFILSIFLYISIKTFIFKTETNLIEIFTILITVILAGMVGFVDDLIGWRKGGLSKTKRIILMFLIAIPLMVINAGESTLLGINFGVLYALILVPLAVIGSTTVFNFLAGFNGLESSQGMILLLSLSVVNFVNGNWWLSLIGLSFASALFAFWFFNKYPAKVFPGDVLTYATGSLIAAIIILGNIEKIGVFFFIPYIIEMILKLRGKLKIQSFGKAEKDGSINLIQQKIYGLEHAAIVLLKKIKPSGKAYEWEVPIVINLFQILIIAIGMYLFL